MSTPTAHRTRVRPCTWTYVTLVLLTFVTWTIGRTGTTGLLTSLAVLGLAIVKGHLIGDWFMGLRNVRGMWRWVILAWLMVPGGLIGLAFVLSYRG